MATAELEKKEAPGALTTIESERAIQEVRGAIIMARQFPRDQAAALARILKACERPDLAEQAIYAYPRGGQTVTGPSIRLAEVLQQNWGNMQAGVRELEQRGGESTAQAYAWDLETNTRMEKTFHVPHVRYSKSGGNARLTDPRDIYEIVANQGARRLRACILSVIPGDIVDAALARCEKTQEASLGAKPQQIQSLLLGFKEIGVTREDVERKIHKKAEEMSTADLLMLRRVGLAIKENMTSKEEAFPPVKAPASGAKDAAAAAAGGLRGAVSRAFGGGKKPEPEQPELTPEEEEGASRAFDEAGQGRQPGED